MFRNLGSNTTQEPEKSLKTKEPQQQPSLEELLGENPPKNTFRVLQGKNASKQPQSPSDSNTTSDEYKFTGTTDSDSISTFTSASHSNNPYRRLQSQTSSRHSSPRQNFLQNPIESNFQASSSFTNSVDFEKAKEKVKDKEKQLQSDENTYLISS